MNCVHCAGPTILNAPGDRVCSSSTCFLGQPLERDTVLVSGERICMSSVDGEPHAYVCESHPERLLGVPGDVYAQREKVFSKDRPQYEPWLLYVTVTGWTIGDEKMMLAICPDCASANYTIIREGK